MKSKTFLEQITHSIEYDSEGNQCHTITDKSGVPAIKYTDKYGNPINPPKQSRIPNNKKRDVANKQDYFLKLYKDNILDILKEKRIKDIDLLTGNTVRRKITPYEAGIFLMLISVVNWQSPYLVHPETNVLMNENNIADYFELNRPQLHKTLKVLNDSGLISIVNNGKGRPNHYLVNANIAFNGRTVNDIKHLDNFGEACEYQPPSIIKYKETEKKK